MLCHQLLLFFGLSLANGVCSSRRCYSEAQVSICFFCSATDVPPVPKDTVKFFLTYNYIRKVISFSLLEHLWLLEIGTQLVHPVTIGKRAFRNLLNLCILDLGDNKILQLHLDAFMGLPSLTVLHLFHNSLGDSILKECYFQDLRSLEELDLSTNEITKLHPHPLFYNLTALKSVNLKFNKISNFFLANLESLNLFKNKINQIQSNLWGELYNYTFAGLCSVTYIDLQQNHIGMIGEKSFRLPSFPHLTSAFLGDNKLISVGNREITATHLELERNWLAKLGDLYVLFQIPDLQYIFLKQN
uniref:Uncharacterized protein n=1 Tax=Geospiza parvula TaxID=87175 RepID=A0A8C3MQ94_GEOPR